MSDIKQIKRLLKSIPMLQAIKSNLQINIDDMESNQTLTADFSEIRAGSATHRISDTVFNEVSRKINLENDERYIYMKKQIMRLDRVLKMTANMVQSLPEEDREIFQLLYYEKKTVNEVAEILGVTRRGLDKKIDRLLLQMVDIYEVVLKDEAEAILSEL